MALIKTPVKGMCDMLPSDMRLREYVQNMIKDCYAKYGFMQIETPVMEHIENLTSKQGGDNEKLIFKVMKRGADLSRAIAAGNQEFADNGLRYDLTCLWQDIMQIIKKNCLHHSKHFRLVMYGVQITHRKAASVSLHSVILIFLVMKQTLQRSSLWLQHPICFQEFLHR